MDLINRLLDILDNSYFFLTLGLGFFGALLVKVYNWGKRDRIYSVSKLEFNEFEKNIRADLRAYRQEILDYVVKHATTIIERELKPLNELSTILKDVKMHEELLKSKLENITELSKKVVQLEENIRIFNVKMKKMESPDGTLKDTRRSDD